MEWVRLLKETGKTDLELALDIGGGEKTLRSLKNIPRDTPSKLADSIETLGLETIDLPWPLEASLQARAMLRLIADKRFSDLYRSQGFLARAAVNRICKNDPTEPLTKEIWGQFLLGYVFLLGMRLSRNTVHIAASEGYDTVNNRLLDALIDKKENWAQLLRFKVMSNSIVTDWKKAKPENRCAAEMQKRIKHRGYFEALAAYNDLIPGDLTAPFNALAIASRLGWRQHYEDLYSRLVKADARYADLSASTDDDIDADFDDFLFWLASRVEQPQTPMLTLGEEKDL
jgi:hypothetical protein